MKVVAYIVDEGRPLRLASDAEVIEPRSDCDRTFDGSTSPPRFRWGTVGEVELKSAEFKVLYALVQASPSGLPPKDMFPKNVRKSACRRVQLTFQKVRRGLPNGTFVGKGQGEALRYFFQPTKGLRYILIAPTDDSGALQRFPSRAPAAPDGSPEASQRIGSVRATLDPPEIPNLTIRLGKRSLGPTGLLVWIAVANLGLERQVIERFTLNAGNWSTSPTRPRGWRKLGLALSHWMVPIEPRGVGKWWLRFPIPEGERELIRAQGATICGHVLR